MLMPSLEETLTADHGPAAAPPRGAVAEYDLDQPTLETARAALGRLYGPHATDVWRTLLFSAGLAGDETDLDSFERLVACMSAAEPITRLCGRSLAVRSGTYKRLSAAQAQIRQG